MHCSARATVKVLINYDEIARRTGVPWPARTSASRRSVSSSRPMAEHPLPRDSSTTTVQGLGDTHRIDVTICDMGHNAPGATDKMTPGHLPVGQALRTKVLIPDHYDNWATPRSIRPSWSASSVRTSQA